MGSWKSELPTEKQRAAILNMQRALGIDSPVPATKGECAEAIGKLKSAIQNNLQVIGTIRGNADDFDGNDDDYDMACF